MTDPVKEAVERLEDDLSRAREDGLVLTDAPRLRTVLSELSRLSRLVEEAGEEGWQPIETAPKDGTAVMLFFPNRYQGSGGISWGCFIGGDWLDSRAIRDNDASHWRPLPEPPRASLTHKAIRGGGE